jgi:hypothetical protein
MNYFWLGTTICLRALPEPDLLFEFSLKREGLSLEIILEIKSLLSLLGISLNSSLSRRASAPADALVPVIPTLGVSPPTYYDLWPAYCSSMGPDWSSKSSSIFLVMLIFLITSSNGGSSALTTLQRLLLIIEVSSSIV